MCGLYLWLPLSSVTAATLKLTFYNFVSLKSPGDNKLPTSMLGLEIHCESEQRPTSQFCGVSFISFFFVLSIFRFKEFIHKCQMKILS